MKKVLVSLLLIISIVATFHTAYASSPNYWSNKEYLQLFYKGYIQFKSSFYDSERGGNVFNAYIRYTDGHDRDTGRLYAGPGQSRNDSKVYSREKVFRDKLCWDCNQSRFYYNFNVAPKNAWPLAYSVTTNTKRDYSIDNWSIENTFEVGGFEILE